MYNEDRKMQFLKDTRGTVEYGVSIFNTIEPYEQEAGLDACDLPAEVLQQIINTKFGLRVRSGDTVIAFLKSYANWCKENGIDVHGGIYDLYVDTRSKARRMMVASPTHLEMIMDQLFDPVQMGTVDCLYRCFLWMAFAGIEDYDALTVKCNEVNFDFMLIEHNGRSYEIYREAVPAFRLACNATSFLYVHPKYEPSMRDRFPGEYLMRGIRSEQLKLTTIRTALHKTFKNHSVDLSYGNIRISGMFYRLYEMERCGESVDFTQIVEENLIKASNHYHESFPRKKHISNVKNDIIKDYNSWKEAFSE